MGEVSTVRFIQAKVTHQATQGNLAMNADQCEQRLLEGTRKLDTVLQPLGFVFRITDSGISSPGPYAVGYYKNGNKNISLIYRSMGLGGSSIAITGRAINIEKRAQSIAA
jgi:hypothetical protein